VTTLYYGAGPGLLREGLCDIGRGIVSERTDGPYTSANRRLCPRSNALTARNLSSSAGPIAHPTADDAGHRQLGVVVLDRARGTLPKNANAAFRPSQNLWRVCAGWACAKQASLCGRSIAKK
jgi:hypothetical protein